MFDIGVRRKFERKVLLTLALVTLVPTLLLGYLVYQQLTQLALNQAERDLRYESKTYGLTLIERLVWFAERELVSDAPRELLRLDPTGEHLVVGGRSFAMSQWIWDLQNSAYGRCVQVNGVNSQCANLAPDSVETLSASWELFLGGNFETDLEVLVVTQVARDEVLAGYGSIARFLVLMAALGSLVVCMFAIRFLRERLQPLTALDEATREISKGNYNTRLHIESNDEFEAVAIGFNRMTENLALSFETMRQLSEIDRLILSSATVDNIVESVLRMCAATLPVELEVALWSGAESEEVTYYRVSNTEFKTVNRVSENRDPQRIGVEVERMSGLDRVTRRIPIEVEGVVSGFLFVEALDTLTSQSMKTIGEFCDRLAVAVTNKRRSEHLFVQANYDSLTGMLNRPAFEARLSHTLKLADRSATPGAFLFLDLDRFKQVNDTEGHKAGDRLLHVVARRISKCLRQVDTVARFGGDEFGVLICEYGDERELTTICDRLLGELSHPIVVDRIQHTVSVSMGIALFPGDAMDAETIFMRADTAMYRAKALGGSQACFYNEEMDVATRSRVVLESRLRQAMEKNQLQLHFQPKLHSESGSIFSAEGLMRWTDAEMGSIAPTRFVPVAEETGLVHQFLPICLEQSARAIAALNHCLDLCVAINVSPRQLVKEGFAARFLDLCGNFDISPKQVELEFTESLLIEDQQLVFRELNALRSNGVKIALDDFGTGYSSLNMLRQLPIDVLKIDRSFIMDIEESTDALGLAKQVIGIAELLGKQVVAEGVETEGQKRLLIESGCHYLQGYLVAKPLPLDQFVEFVNAHQKNGADSPAATSPVAVGHA